MLLAGADGWTSTTKGTRITPATGRDVAEKIELQMRIERGVDCIG
jgi:hypothetical protein